MYYLIIHLFQEEYQKDLIFALTEAGVKDVMVTDAVNVSRRLAHDLPIYAGFKGELGKTSQVCRIFQVVIESDSVIQRIMNSLTKAEIDFEKEDIGRIFMIPLQKPSLLKIIGEVSDPDDIDIKKKRVSKQKI